MPRDLARLTFDFHAMSGMIANGLTSPTPISRGEFGANGVRGILALLAKLGINPHGPLSPNGAPEADSYRAAFITLTARRLR